MTEFTITESTLGSSPVVVVSGADGAVTASIALRGATLLSWVVTDAGEPIELVDGYATEQELLEQHGVRNGIMAPFTNRQRDGRYEFDGESHDLRGSSPTDPDLVLHGLLRERDFTVDSVETGENSAVIRFSSSALDGSIAGYPFVVRVGVEYEFSDTALRIRITGSNDGETDAPFASGWHPYFRLGRASVADLELTVPATVRVVTDDELIPLDGRAAFVALDDDDPLSLRSGLPIGDAVIDACFTGLQGFEGGPFHTQLRDPASGRALDVWQERGSMHVYTADHLDREPRRSIALEPVERLTDAFNRGDQRAHVVLRPGQSRSFSFGVYLVPATAA
ncbi:aldose 1-epimerase [Herbiconiux sp. UC225_62]|uniref:aldose 1-epimerase n=1 Tax=Herbiconiux sp. UC225_62 TaxID=3350168 RepID=UPI0036D39290